MDNENRIEDLRQKYETFINAYPDAGTFLEFCTWQETLEVKGMMAHLPQIKRALDESKTNVDLIHTKVIAIADKVDPLLETVNMVMSKFR